MTSRLSTLIASGRSITACLHGEHDAHAALADLALHVVAAVERLADEPRRTRSRSCAGSSSASVVLVRRRVSSRVPARESRPRRAPGCVRGCRGARRLDLRSASLRDARRQHRRLVGGDARASTSGLPSNGQKPGSANERWQAGHWYVTCRVTRVVVQRRPVVREDLVVRGDDEDRAGR